MTQQWDETPERDMTEKDYEEEHTDVKKKEPRWAKRGTASRIIPRSER